MRLELLVVVGPVVEHQGMESDSKCKENELWKQHCLWLMDDEAFSHLQKFDLETFLFSYHWPGKDGKGRLLLVCSVFVFPYFFFTKRQFFSYHPS
jgi:hypothetical protein